MKVFISYYSYPPFISYPYLLHLIISVSNTKSSRSAVPLPPSSNTANTRDDDFFDRRHAGHDERASNTTIRENFRQHFRSFDAKLSDKQRKMALKIYHSFLKRIYADNEKLKKAGIMPVRVKNGDQRGIFVRHIHTI